MLQHNVLPNVNHSVSQSVSFAFWLHQVSSEAALSGALLAFGVDSPVFGKGAMDAPTVLNGVAGHGRQGSDDSQTPRALLTPPDSAHGGIGTDGAETARRASGVANNNRRSRDNNNNNGVVDPRPSSRPRTSASGSLL
jgi:hypothetical protein